MKNSGPFHPGEVFIQEQTEERGLALLNARNIEDYIISPAHKFLAQQSYVAISAFSGGLLSGTIAYGSPGFITTDPAGEILSIDLTAVTTQDSDPVFKNLKAGDEMGAIVIDFATRKRLRLNGRVVEFSRTVLRMAVRESWPTCPKHIPKRIVETAERPLTEASYTVKQVLDTECETIIANSDTFFVASVGPDGRVDMSNRGGNPGFVRIKDGVLKIPDYKGNSLFTTFGNLHLNPKAALVFWDFMSARLLHLWGEAHVTLDGYDPNNQTTNTGRYWTFKIQNLALQKAPIPFNLKLVEESPYNPEIKNPF